MKNLYIITGVKICTEIIINLINKYDNWITVTKDNNMNNM